MTTHQFSLFGFTAPTRKVPISAARIKEAKALLAKGDAKACAAKMREVLERLEDYELRIKSK